MPQVLDRAAGEIRVGSRVERCLGYRTGGIAGTAVKGSDHRVIWVRWDGHGDLKRYAVEREWRSLFRRRYFCPELLLAQSNDERSE